MRLLLDSCVWGQAATELRTAGHDVVCASDWPADPGDEQVLAFAAREHRVLVTLDKDFGTLATLEQRAHCGIIRLVDIAARRQAGAILGVIALYAEDLDLQSVITVEPGRVRIRRRVAP